MMEQFRIGPVVTMVDAVHGAQALDEHREAVKQVAVADRLVLSKIDLAKPETIEPLVKRLTLLNPGAPLFRAGRDSVSPDKLFGGAGFGSTTRSRKCASGSTRKRTRITAMTMGTIIMTTITAAATIRMRTIPIGTTIASERIATHSTSR